MEFEPGVYCVSNLTAVLFSRAREFIDVSIPMEYFTVSGFERSVSLLHSGHAAALPCICIS